MSFYDNSPKAYETYQRKQAEVATWARQAPPHHSVDTPGWQTPEHYGHGTPLGSVVRPPPSSGYPPQAISDRTRSSSRPHSHGSIRLNQQPFAMPSHGLPNSARGTPSAPSTFVYQPPSTVGSASASRTQSSGPGTGRSRTMDYPPSHVPSQHPPSPVPGQYVMVPTMPNTSGVVPPRSGTHRSSSNSSYPSVNERSNQTQYPPGFVPYGTSVASSVPGARPGSSGSSSAPFIPSVGGIPDQEGLPQGFSDTSSRPTTTRSFPHDQGHAYPASNSVTALSYTSNGTQCGQSAVPAYVQSPASMSSRSGDRHVRSRSLSVSSRSSDETIHVQAPRNSTHYLQPGTSSAWLTSQVSGDLVTLVARATHLAAQERQRQQLGISPSQRSVDPNCPFKEIVLDPGASVTVDGCRVVNQGSTRQTYWIYSQDDLRASLGLPKVEVVGERQGRKTDKERRRRRERSRSREGSRY